ncbi:Outer membrane protein B precursor [Poriferisphaera corsica]|uniref:Outer membrane protein B n=1 Tax=Poriferisphaera corsica TaxID=2528020 RepID=A0A517YZ08_9BACT|nr:autotransporter outer membrane beta-barrel domain-containing protein [Poriferisphaera corsica]QDU35456.1 Outer membrane protein B precursor [Poriferisphaera corsica]
MTNSPVTFKTSYLLAAFCSMSLTAPAFAGFVATAPLDIEYQIGSGTEPYDINVGGGAYTVDIGADIVGAGPNGSHLVDLTNPAISDWLKTDQPTTVNFDGKVAINAIKPGFYAIYTTSTDDLNLNFSDTALLQVDSTGAHTYAIFSSQGNVNLNDFAGDLTVNSGDSSGQSFANGIYAQNDIIADSITTDSSINVSGTGTNVYGIRSDSGNIDITNAFAGDITVDAGANGSNESYAYGLYANGDINIGSVSSDSHIDITGTGNFVFGMVSGGNISIANPFAGDITVNAGDSSGQSFANGLYTTLNINLDSVTSDSQIVVTGTGNSVYGFNALLGDINITNDFAGDLIVNAGQNGSGESAAYGLYAWNDISIGSVNSGSQILVTGTGHGVYGLYASNGHIDITNAFAGDITVDAGANGSNESFAYGLYANGDINIGSVASDSHIDVTGTGSDVYGLYSNSGNINIIGNFAGTIAAQGTDNVYGIFAPSLSIQNITGTISATATDIDGHAAAITTESWDGSAWSGSAASDDTVTLSSGANIIGDIRLGDNDNTAGPGDLPTDDTLTLQGAGTFNHNLYGIETLVIQQDIGTTSATDEVWTLNLLDAADDGSQQLNTLTTIDIQHGLLATNGNLQTENLNVETGGGLFFNLHSADGTTDTINAGNVTFAEGAIIRTQLDGVLIEDTTFTLVTTDTGITIDSSGDVADLINVLDTALIDYKGKLSLDGNNLLIEASTFADLQEFANGTAFNAATSLQNALDQLADGDDLEDILDQFQDMTEDELREELNKIGPQSSLTTANATTSAAISVVGKFTGRSSGLANAATKADSDTYALLLSGPSLRDQDGYEVWTSAFGSYTDQDDQDNILGYRSTAVGSLVGIDRQSENALIGFALGYANADVDTHNSNSSTKLDALTAGLYFAYQPSKFKYEAGSIYTLGMSDYERETALNRTAEANDVLSHSFTNYIGTSYQMNFNDGRISFTPNAQLAYTYFTQESYSESNAGSLGLDVDSFSSDIVTATVGAKAEYQYNDQLTFNGLLLYKYDFTNDAPTVESTFQAFGSTPFQTTGIEADKVAIEFGAGFDYQISDKLKASLDYSYEHRSSLKTQNLTVGLNLLF